MSRVRRTVSSNFAGSAANFGAKRWTNHGAARTPRATMKGSARSSTDAIDRTRARLLALSSRAFSSERVGMNAACSAPSASSCRNMFGMRNAV